MTIKPVLKNRPTKHGLHTILLYVNINGSPMRLTTGLRIDKKVWNPNKGHVKGKNALAAKQNAHIKALVAKASEIVLTYVHEKKPLSNTLFKQEWYGSSSPLPQHNFIQFYRTRMTEAHKKGDITKGTLTTERRSLRKLIRFAGSHLPPNHITREFLENLDTAHSKWLAEKGHTGITERRRLFLNIRKYLRFAQNEGHQVSPSAFYKKKLPTSRPDPTPLTEAEVRLLISLIESPSTILDRLREKATTRGLTPWHASRYVCQEKVDKVQRVLRAFLFSCFTGFRYSDLKRIQYTHIKNNLITYQPHKTRRTSGITIRIQINKMISRFIPPRSSSPYLFHTLPNNCECNLEIKHICTLIPELATRPTKMHDARHTFITMSIARGVPIERVKKLAGIKSLSTLQVYLHIANDLANSSLTSAYAHF